MKSTNKLSFLNFGVAWLMGSLVTSFVLGFIKSFYVQSWQWLAWGVFWQTALVLVGYFLFTEVTARFQWARHGMMTIALLVGFAFSGAVVWLCTRFPMMFDASLFVFHPQDWPLLAGLFVASALWTFLLLWQLQARQLDQAFTSSRFFIFLRAHLPALLMAAAFFAAYFTLAVTYSIAYRGLSQAVDDNFYDADPASWMIRMASPASRLIDMRPVHPFAYLIFRPLTWLLSLLLNGNRFYAALLLNASVGALCVFLAWLFMKHWANNTYALLTATLLGATVSHLLFSIFLETYIYSAAALIAFLILIQRENKSLRWLVPAGLLTFGLTITNFIQTGIVFVLTDFKITKIAKYVLIVLALALILAFVQVKIYPTSQPFYIPSDMLAEKRYSFDIMTTPLRQTYMRGYALGRTITLFSTVGPRPLDLLADVGCSFPCFKVYKPGYNGGLITSYAGFGSWLARLWFLILLAALGFFTWKLVKSPKSVSLQAALLICVAFNFVLHLTYGDDPMLYSPDWTYAVIFFVALSFQTFAHKRWFQAAMLVFLALLMVNNWTFLHAMLVDVAPYF